MGTRTTESRPIIREALATCPDEITPHQSQEFAFIKDPEIRFGLLRDLETTRSALLHEEWKAATVIAGSIVEALLLWAIKQRNDSDIKAAVSKGAKKGLWAKAPSSDSVDWNLHQYIEIAVELHLVEAETADQARLAKDFRNLIHPGRSLRKQQVCDRGTALAANAAAELVARDLKQCFT